MSTIVADPAVVSELEPPPASGSQGRRRSGYPRYVALKVLGSTGSLFFMLVVNFFLIRVIPGDPARTLARNRLSSASALNELRKTYGLNESLPQQFITYLNNTLHGDLGISFRYRVPVSDLLGQRMWPTIFLVGTSTLLATLIGLYIGVIGAWHRGRRFDQISTSGGLVLYAMPEWWLGLLLLAVFAVGIGPIPGMFPTGGLIDPNIAMWSPEGIINMAWHLTLPVVTLTLAYLAEYSLIMRSALLDEMGEDYLTTARAKGLRDVVVRRRHAVRNAMLPSTTQVALNFGYVVSGAITVETVFSIPGLGLLSSEAISIPDYWVLQGTFLVGTAAVIVANLCAALLYGWLDPRVRV
ncbi:MAG: ABC transporter permease [Nocardioidaceae bacterium]